VTLSLPGGGLAVIESVSEEGGELVATARLLEHEVVSLR